MEDQINQTLLVTAIDFGTTYSGWAYSFKHDYESDPMKVFTKLWFGGQNMSMKTPTTVLISPDGKTLEAFGYKAEDKYNDLALDDKHYNHFYFQRFKMLLYDNNGLNRDVEIKDIRGKPLLAKTVFSLAISHLREDVLKSCKDCVGKGCVVEAEIDWVITVPAIWDDSAKQFMREAAVQGGISNEKLVIALEPESASVFCRLLQVEKVFSQRDTGSLSGFRPGAKYLVLDAGGGTVDTTVHQVMEDGNLRELHRASGGHWGGTKVDEAFVELLIRLVGSRVLTRFQTETTYDYLKLMREFEVKKRYIGPDTTMRIHFSIPLELREFFS